MTAFDYVLMFCMIAVTILTAAFIWRVATQKPDFPLRPYTGEEYDRIMFRARENFEAKRHNGEPPKIHDHWMLNGQMEQALRACAKAAQYEISPPTKDADRERYKHQLFNVPDMIATRIRRLNEEVSQFRMHIQELQEELADCRKELNQSQQLVFKLRHPSTGETRP